jgi:hypothetical protein
MEAKRLATIRRFADQTETSRPSDEQARLLIRPCKPLQTTNLLART